MGITVDANRIMFPTRRRFNAAWQEAQGLRLRLLPQVMGVCAGGLDATVCRVSALRPGWGSTAMRQWTAGHQARGCRS